MRLQKIEISTENLTTDEQEAILDYVKMSLQQRYSPRGLASNGRITQEDVKFVFERDLHSLVFRHTVSARKEELENKSLDEDTRDFSNFKREVQKR